MASLATHNGVFSIKSTKTGDHRTFRVRIQKQDAAFAPGKRILGLLTGSDNTNSYTNFAFVDDFGIHIWGKKQTETYLAYARMLENLAKHEANKLIEVHAETTCRCCNRKLTTPESVISGIGPICAKKN